MAPEEVFSIIYQENIWGGQPGNFFSGTGTADTNTILYIKEVVAFIREKNIRTIFENGCGDFSIMHKVLLQAEEINYTGMDVVTDLVNFNNLHFANEKIKFIPGNAVETPLPTADLIIIRQVLQHLDNAAIEKILDKLRSYPFALITEHIPIAKDVKFNIDKITGPNIRMKMNSGVFIDKPPFSLPNVSLFKSYRVDDLVNKKMVPAVMHTSLYEKNPAAKIY